MKLSLIESRLFGKICYGFRRDCNGIIEIAEKEAKIVKDIFAQYLSDSSLEKIQKYLSDNEIYSPSGKVLWSRDVLNKVLNNMKYTSGIIDMDTYWEVQFMKSNNCRNPNRDMGELNTWLQGLCNN
jgi:hypothetical protein